MPGAEAEAVGAKIKARIEALKNAANGGSTGTVGPAVVGAVAPQEGKKKKENKKEKKEEIAYQNLKLRPWEIKENVRKLKLERFGFENNYGKKNI